MRFYIVEEINVDLLTVYLDFDIFGNVRVYNMFED